MKKIRYSEERLRLYLLGELPAPEQAALETEYFADRELYDQLCEAEHDLIDDFVRGRMPAADQERFERHYLTTPERRQQVEFARAMGRSLAQTESTEMKTQGRASSALTDWWPRLLAPWRSPQPALGFSLVLAVILALGGAWLLINTLRLRRELAAVQSSGSTLRQREQELERQIASQREQRDQLTTELERVRNQLRIAGEKQTDPSSIPAVVTLLFPARPVRGESEQKTLRVPPTAEIVQIQLELKSDGLTNYQAIVETPEGKSIWTRRQVRARGATVILNIPAGLLPTGDYILTLSGLSAAGEVVDVSNSYFRVNKR